MIDIRPAIAVPSLSIVAASVVVELPAVVITVLFPRAWVTSPGKAGESV